MDLSLLTILERAYKARATNIHHQERRRCPRVALEQPARILMSNGTRVDVTVTDISSEAMQVTCDLPGTRELWAARRAQSQERALMVIVSVNLPMSRSIGGLTAVVEIFNFSPCDDTSGRFALRFIQFDDNAREILDDFLSQSLP